MAVNLNLAISIFGFLLTAIFIFIMCCRLLCTRFRQSQRALDLMRDNSLGILGNREGLEQSVVATFPTVNYKNHLFTLDEDNLCTICIGEYEEKELLQIIPHCGHIFHVGCIGEWLKQHHTCPICRISLRDALQRKHYSSRQWALYSKFAPGVLHDEEIEGLKNFSSISTEALHQAMIGVDDLVLDLEMGESAERESDEEIRSSSEGTSTSGTLARAKSSLYDEMLKESNDSSFALALIPSEAYQKNPDIHVNDIGVEIGESSSNRTRMESVENDRPTNQVRMESDEKKCSDVRLNFPRDVSQSKENTTGTRTMSVLCDENNKESKTLLSLPASTFSHEDDKECMVGIDQVYLKHIQDSNSSETDIISGKKRHVNRLEVTMTEKLKELSTVPTLMADDVSKQIPHLQTIVVRDQTHQELYSRQREAETEHKKPENLLNACNDV